AGLALPKITRVAINPGENQRGWNDMSPPFDEYSALRIRHAGAVDVPDGQTGQPQEIYDFYVNVDNLYLNTELKGSKGEEIELLRAKFIYGLVLLGLALVNFEEKSSPDEGTSDTNIEDKVEEFSKAVSVVLLPIINELSDLEIEFD
ncbi:MAG TPA: hypothetical protein VI387_02175, partial [Candidatus Brocadiales bacterium]|nr:hypothetical protein [Candidatus Brocadiales bacterium]